MTWLPGLPDGETDWDRLSVLCPEAVDALSGVVAAAWQGADPALLELARLRIAALLGNTVELAERSIRAREAGVTEEQVAELPAWSTSSLFTARERACLSLTEQFATDANDVSDAQVADVTEHLGADGCYAFVEAVSVLETFQRACLTLGVESGPGVDEIARTPRSDPRSGQVALGGGALKPRIPLAPGSVNRWGLADTSGIVPAIAAARQRLRRVAFGMRTVDPVTTELVRIRNARFQNCFF